MKKLKCTTISDTHTHHENMKPLRGGDFLFYAGDMSYFGQKDEVLPFLDWLGAQDYTYKVLIAGNHDFGFEEPGAGDHERCFRNPKRFFFRGQELYQGLEHRYKQVCEEKGITYLNSEQVELGGLKIYGDPRQPYFHNWAFQYDRDDAKEVWADLPSGMDVIVTHGPPEGILDHNPSEPEGFRCGCSELLEAVKRAKPRYHIFGHIHEGTGRVRKHNINFINASTCGLPDYENLSDPIDFDLTLKVN